MRFQLFVVERADSPDLRDGLFCASPCVAQRVLKGLAELFEDTAVHDGGDGYGRDDREHDEREAPGDGKQERDPAQNGHGCPDPHRDVDGHCVLDDGRVGREPVDQLARPVGVKEPDLLRHHGGKQIDPERRHHPLPCQGKQPSADKGGHRAHGKHDQKLRNVSVQPVLGLVLGHARLARHGRDDQTHVVRDGQRSHGCHQQRHHPCAQHPAHRLGQLGQPPDARMVLVFLVPLVHPHRDGASRLALDRTVGTGCRRL